MNANKVLVSVAMLAGVLLVGCSTLKDWSAGAQRWYSEQQVKWREQKEREFKQLSSLPPAQVISATHPDIAKCAQASCALFNEVHPKMKAYVAFSETSHEYTGFINDVQYYVEEEKLAPRAAILKVKTEVLAADAQRPDGEKLWPKIRKGYAAAKVLGSRDGLSHIMALISRQLEISTALTKIGKSLSDRQKELKALKKSKKAKQVDGKAYDKAVAQINQWERECAAVNQQMNVTRRCLSFMQDQFNRNVELEEYAR